MPRGQRRLPEACEREIAAADMLLHLGDFCERPVLESLQRIGPPMVAVHGNVDSAELRELLPRRRCLVVERIRIGLVHDAGPRSGRLERLRDRFPATDVVFFGHSHMPLHERASDFEIFNPGSPTERRRAPARSMGIAEIHDGAIRLRHLTLG